MEQPSGKNRGPHRVGVRGAVGSWEPLSDTPCGEKSAMGFSMKYDIQEPSGFSPLEPQHPPKPNCYTNPKPS